MYAVIELCGKQYKVSQGDELLVDRIALDEGKSMSLTPILLGGEQKAVTEAELKGAKVKARVEEHLLGKKIRVFKYKPKCGYRRTKGHRSRLSKVTIQTITAPGGKKAEAKAETKAPKAEAKPAEPKAAKAKAETKSAKADSKPAKAETKTAKKETKPEKE
ncbi:MAG: 50S ribosomal protein L21 [Thermoleophilia bacterium]|nr:50S ribosomal protein L21 [Thermoleophilia bacterium]